MKKNYIILSIILWIVNYAAGQSDKSLKFFGDFRFRTEMERDLQNNSGYKLPVNDKLLFSFRFGVKYHYKSNWTFGGRIGTGNPEMPQSSDVEIGKGFTGKSISLNKAYVKFHKYNFYANLGKTGINIWEPDQILWDIDINPEGIGLGKKFYLHNLGNISLKTGYYIAGNTSNYSGQSFKEYNYLATAQIKYNYNIFKHRFILAPVYMEAHIPDYITEKINYQIFTTYFEYRFMNNFKFNFDYFHNFQNLKNKVDPAWQDEKNGFLISASYKFYRRKFLAKISYTEIEKYAVIDRFAQNDWVAWQTRDSNGIQYTRGSNFGGFAFSLNYRINPEISTRIQFWKVETLQKASFDKTPETGTRIRIDFNMKF